MFAVLIVTVVSALPGAEAYIEARDAERAGRRDAAIEAYEKCIAADEALAPFARLRIIGCRFHGQDEANAVPAYETFLSSEAAGPWTSMGQAVLALRQAKASQPAAAASLLDPLVKSDVSLWWFADYADAAVAAWLELPERRDEALGFLRTTVQTTVQWKPRIDAARRLALSPNPEDRVIAAFGIFRSGAAKDAETLLLPVAASAISGEAVTLDRALLDEWAEASKPRDCAPAWWKALSESSAGVGIERVWLAGMVRRAIAADAPERAGEILDALLTRYPGTSEGAEACWALAKYLERKDALDEASATFVLLVRHCPKHFRADDALMNAARLLESQKKTADAAAVLDRLQKEYPDSRHVSFAWYELGRLAEIGGDGKAAADNYAEASKLPAGDYYMHRARERRYALGVAAPDAADNLMIDGSETFLRPLPHPDAAPAVSAAMLEDPRLQRLFFFGENGLEEGEWEALAIGRTLKDDPAPDDSYQALADAGFSHTAGEFADAYGWGLDAGRPTEARLRTSFPRAYWPEVSALARESGIDPYLVLAVARQESTFRPALTSSAGARGVMQVMPTTAAWVAKLEPSIAPDAAQHLEVPANALRIGTIYLQRMIERCDGNLAYGLASYNAGPGNLKKWREDNPDADLETFIESIPFQETRDYVKTVLGNYAAYHSLYPPAETAPSAD